MSATRDAGTNLDGSGLAAGTGHLPEAEARIDARPHPVEVLVDHEDMRIVGPGQGRERARFAFPPDDGRHGARGVEQIPGRARPADVADPRDGRAIRADHGMIGVKEELPVMAVGRTSRSQQAKDQLITMLRHHQAHFAEDRAEDARAVIADMVAGVALPPPRSVAVDSTLTTLRRPPRVLATAARADSAGPSLTPQHCARAATSALAARFKIKIGRAHV